MKNENLDIKVGAVQTLAAFITVSEAKECRKFENLAVLALEASYFVM
jgi:hypothetical protein